MRRIKFRNVIVMAAGIAALLAIGQFPALAAGKEGRQAAKPKFIDDCERYKEPLTYNACLASFGPARHGGGAMVTPEIASNGDSATTDARPASSSRYSRRQGRNSRYHRNRQGRASATFTVPQAIISGNGLGRR